MLRELITDDITINVDGNLKLELSLIVESTQSFSIKIESEDFYKNTTFDVAGNSIDGNVVLKYFSSEDCSHRSISVKRDITLDALANLFTPLYLLKQMGIES